MEGYGVKRPTITKAWVDDMDRMLRLDERDPDKAERVIRWLFSDADEVCSFWSTNVHSPKKLRSQWDKMQLAYRNRVERAKPPKQSAIMDSISKIRERDSQ